MHMKTRKHPRVMPMPGAPVSVSFLEPELLDLNKTLEVRDLSLGGMGIKVPLGNKLVQSGMEVRGMKLALGSDVTCTLSGTFVYRKLGVCGMEFRFCDPGEIDKVDGYIAEYYPRASRRSD